MVESIINVISDNLTNVLPAEAIIFIISIVPILELRGGLIAASLLNVRWIYAFPICIIGNLLPLPFILFFINKIFTFLKRTKLKKFVEYLEKKANVKSKSVIKYKKWGLFLFVATPLPGTGGWTGALIASMLQIKPKDALPPIVFGVIVAGIIMSIISYIIPSFF